MSHRKKKINWSFVILLEQESLSYHCEQNGESSEDRKHRQADGRRHLDVNIHA